MIKFEVGKTYKTICIANSEIYYSYKVLKRTASTVTITDGKITKTCRINKYLTERDNIEAILPEGRYSMCPILHAA